MTAWSREQLAAFYEQLGRQLAAGLTLAECLRAPSSAPAADTFRMASLAEAGVSSRKIFATAGNWLPQKDRPLLAAGAAAGRLPTVCTHLAERHYRLAETGRRLAFMLLYPKLVFT